MSYRRFRPAVIAGVSLFVFASGAAAQAPVPEEARMAMEPLAWLAGRWSGQATVVGPEGVKAVRQTEEVRAALEGALLVVEGTGREPGTGGEPGPVVFRAFAVLSAGDEPGNYRFAAWQGGRFVDARAKIAEDGALSWGFETPDGGRVEYVIRHPEPDVWHEVGSYLPPGQDAGRTFFEMTLHREPTENAR
ncbi:MAG TPA: hypothetical protein VFH11_01155 [Gemmatimonadota bacterium]|nr:hypothetical protein [Gemmatimonadota bacterium]